MFELETGLIFWNAVSFGILVLVMYLWALPPIVKCLNARENAIQQAIAGAEESGKKAQEALAAAKQRISDASATAQKIVDQAAIEAEKLKEEMVAAARKETERLTVKAKEELNREKAHIVSEVKRHAAELVMAAASKILRKEIDAEENSRLIADDIKECSM